jgi:hypothetical protein
MRHNSPEISRRALLGAVCAAPVLSRHPGLDPGSTFPSPAPAGRKWIPDQVRDDEAGDTSTVALWNRALLRFHRTDAALRAAFPGPDQARYDSLHDESVDALRRLLRTPAPDVTAMCAKLTLAMAHEAWELPGGEACMAAIEQDGRRLGQY